METNTLNSKAIYKEAYAIMKPKLWLVMGSFMGVVFLSGLLDFFGKNNLIVSVIVSTISAFVITSMALGYARKGSFSFDAFQKGFTLKRFGLFVAIYLLARVIIYIGFFLLLIPGIIAAIQLFPMKYVALEEDIKVLDAVKRSRDLTKGNRWQIFECVMYAMLINLIGVICVFVGLFFTIPLTLIGFALIYKKLTHGAHPEKEAEKAVGEAEVVVVEVDVVTV